MTKPLVPLIAIISNILLWPSLATAAAATIITTTAAAEIPTSQSAKSASFSVPTPSPVLVVESSLPGPFTLQATTAAVDGSELGRLEDGVGQGNGLRVGRRKGDLLLEETAWSALLSSGMCGGGGVDCSAVSGSHVASRTGQAGQLVRLNVDVDEHGGCEVQRQRQRQRYVLVFYC